MDVILHLLAHIAKVHSVEAVSVEHAVVALLAQAEASEVEEAVDLLAEEAQVEASETAEDVRVKYKSRRVEKSLN